MTTKKATTPAQPDTEDTQPLRDADGNVIDPEVGGTTPPDLDAPTTSPPPDEFDSSTVEDEKPVTMADVAAINGIGLAPDASPDVTVSPEDVPFISAGMASDLEQQGWTLDPLTGRKITRE